MTAAEPPIAAGELVRLTSGLPPEQAARVIAAVGMRPEQLDAWHQLRAAWPIGSLEPVPFLDWSAPTRDRLATELDPAVADALANGVDVYDAFNAQPPPVRLALTGDLDPLELSPRLLACEGVASVTVPMTRPVGTLRQRPWNWPLRLGCTDPRLAKAAGSNRWGAAGPPTPSDLIDVSDATRDRRALDVLLVQASLDDAVTQLRRLRPVANVVVVSGEALGVWPVVAANFAMLRAITGAVAVAVVPSLSVTRLARALRWLVFVASHGHPIDVALTRAFERNLLVGAELDALAASALPLQLPSRARELSDDLARATIAKPPDRDDSHQQEQQLEQEQHEDQGDLAGPLGEDPDLTDPVVIGPGRAPLVGGINPHLRQQLDDLARLNLGSFRHESEASWEAQRLSRKIEEAVTKASPERSLQVYVHPPDELPTAQNTLARGTNSVDVFIGPTEAGALAGLRVTNVQLGFTETSKTVRVTAVLVPLQPPGPPVRAELDVPRTGRSLNATLAWTIPARTRRAQARLLLLHRNRVIQTGLLAGEVGGAVTLTERILLWDGVSDLDDRQPFDLSLVLNHDQDGHARAVAHANGSTVTIPVRQELSGPTERLRKCLIRASALKGTGKVRDEAIRTLFIDAAVEGKRLHNFIVGAFKPFSPADHIQVITTRPTWFLPLELVYDGPAPDDDAQLCPTWQAGGKCDDQCFTAGSEHLIVCPHAFWGMSRVIERHWVDFTGAPGEDEFRITNIPQYQRNLLKVSQALVAASRRIAPADVNRTVAAFGKSAVHATSWDAWAATIGDTKLAPDLLVIMPHTDAQADTMEISNKTLRGGRVDAVRYVTGGRESHPVVILFGCDTAGSLQDPAGWATLFMQMNAGVVFSTLTMLLNRHAAELSQELAADLLSDPHEPQSLGELIQQFRIKAVRQGLIAALAVTAYGDSDWRI